MTGDNMRKVKMILIISFLLVLSLGTGVVLGILSRNKGPKADPDKGSEQQAKAVLGAKAGTSAEAETTENTANAGNGAESSSGKDDQTANNSLADSSADSSMVPSDLSSSPENSATEDGYAAQQADYTNIDFVSTDSSFYTYEQMMTDLTEMSQAFPTLMTVNMCGTSLDGRAIPEAVLGNPESGRHLFIQASIHAREYINTLLAMEQIEQMLVHHSDGSSGDVAYDELLSQVCFHILPMSNPDGVTISQMGIDGIRDEGLKEILMNCYRSDLDNGRTSSDMGSYWSTWKANARGVDLNRNFDAGWETYEGVSYPSSDHYKGESPVSEPETRAIVDAVHACEAVLTVSYHSMGGVLYWDYGSAGEVYEQDAALVNLIASVTGYPATSSVQSSQDAAGCSDYFVLKEGIPSVTIENGYSPCPIGIEEFPSIWNSNADLLPALAFAYR